MRRRVLGFLLVTALLLAFATLAGGCAEGDELTLEEYFQQLESLSEDADERIDLVIADLRDEMLGAASVEEEVQVSRDLWTASEAIVGDFVEDIKNLDPPAEAEDAHKEFVEAGEEMQEALQDFFSQLDEVQSQRDLDELRRELDRAEAGEHSDQACLALQSIADANQIHVDLECEE